MASICSFMPKNLLRVLSSSGPQRVGSIIIRCTTNSAPHNQPPRPKIKTKDPKTHAFPTANNEKIQMGGEAMLTSSSTGEDKSSNQASSQ